MQEDQNFSQELQVGESIFFGSRGCGKGVESLRILYFERRELTFLQLQQLHLVTETRNFAGFIDVKKMPWKFPFKTYSFIKYAQIKGLFEKTLFTFT